MIVANKGSITENQMKVYGLSGKSGTGKSYNAIELSGRRGIPAIIDDGLLIYENSLVVGKSAKKQPTKIGSVKTALFTDDDHCLEVRSKIAELAPDSILILGTSDEMIRRIARRLELPEPSEIIYIEDITTPEQREKAEKSRGEAGTHIIPAPTFQVRKQFSGYLLDPKKSFSGTQGSERDIEKTVVRPTYSYLGDYSISDKVITDIVAHFVRIMPGVDQLILAAVENSEDGLYIRAILQAERGVKLRSVATDMQIAIRNAVSYMTAFNVLGVEIEMRSFAPRVPAHGKS